MVSKITPIEEKFLRKFEDTRKNKLSLGHSKKEYDKSKDILVSKIGGIPYWPVSKKEHYPTLQGRKLKLTCQINLDEISEQYNIEEINSLLPKHGILQFYTINDLYNVYTPEQNSVVVYHPNTQEEHYLNEEELHINTQSPSYRVDFFLDSELLGAQDEIYVEKFKELFTGNSQELQDFYYEYLEFQNKGSKIGGYAFFNKEDPFVLLEDSDEVVLLLQLDEELTKVDTSLMNWRILAKDLKTLNFDNVIYHDE